MKAADGFGCAAHIGHFGNHLGVVGDELTGVVAVEFVLGSARQCDVHFLLPGFTSCVEHRAGETFGIGSHDVVAGRTQLQHVVDFLHIESGGIIDISVGAGDGDNLGTQLGSFEGSAPCHIAETADGYCFSFYLVVALFEHVLNEVEGAEACSLRTDTAAAEFETFTSERSVVLVYEFLVHAEHVADFTSAYTDIACGDIAVGTEILPQTQNECLAETHYLTVALSTGREVGTAFATAHRQSGKRIFEGLFEA